MRYAFIQNHREAFPVSLLCQVLEEGRSRFYAWLKRPASPRARENRRLVEAIKAVHYRSRQTCGSPRIPTDLQAQRQTCGKYRMAQLMRRHGIVSRHKRTYKATTNSKHVHPVAPNSLNRQVTVVKPNRNWVSDITSIPLKRGGCLWP